MQGSRQAKRHTRSANTRGVNYYSARTHKQPSDRDFTQQSKGDKALTITTQGTRACTRVKLHNGNPHPHTSPNALLSKEPMYRVAETRGFSTESLHSYQTGRQQPTTIGSFKQC